MPNYIAEMWEELSQERPPGEKPLPEDDMVAFEHIFYCGAASVIEQIVRSGMAAGEVLDAIYQELAEYRKNFELRKDSRKESKSGAKLRKPRRR